MSQPLRDARVAELFDAHSQALQLYARQWVGAIEADDVVQRVSVRMLSIGRLPQEARTWLFRCVRNEAIDVCRSKRRRDKREAAVALSEGEWFLQRPEMSLDAREAQTALESLPRDLREVVTLRLWSGLTLAEIAEVTEVAISTVHDRYQAALESLRKVMEVPCKSRK